MRFTRRALAATTALALATLGASGAFAADATGCTGSATSYSADGTQLQQVTAPGPGATKDDPFQVDYDGTVAWEGTTDAAIQNGTWTVTARPFSYTGEVTNASGKTTAKGEASPSDYLPFAVPGLVQVTVDVTGQGGTCTASGWIRFTGNPLSSPAGWVAVGLTVLGAIGLLGLVRMAARVPEAPVKQHRFARVVLGLLAGLVLGVGVAALLVMFAVIALGTNAPVMVALGAGVVGGALGLLPRRTPAG